MLGPNGKVEYLTREKPNIDRVINVLWQAENPRHEGQRPNGLFYPVTTKNGNHDVACGIDLDQNPQYQKEANRGISRERANQIVRQRLDPALEKIDQGLSLFTERPDTISPQIKEGLLDMYWQLDNKKLIPRQENGVITGGYPNLFKAIAEGDYDKIKEESKVQFKNRKGEWQYDKRRHQLRLDNYFNYQVAPYLNPEIGLPDDLLIK